MHGSANAYVISGKEMDTVGSLGFYAQPSQKVPGSVGDPVKKNRVRAIEEDT